MQGNAIPDQLMNGELTALKHEIQLLRERLEQQSQQTRAAVAHARLLQDQLAAETAARVEAQVSVISFFYFFIFFVTWIEIATEYNSID